MSTLDFKSKRFQYFHHPEGSFGGAIGGSIESSHKGPGTIPDSTVQQDNGGLRLADRLLRGEDMPDFETLARQVLRVSIDQPAGQKPTESGTGLIADSAQCRIHLIYRPNRSWLRSDRAALDAEKAADIAKANTGNKPCLVFAAVGFMSRRALRNRNIAFRQLPYALQARIEEPLGATGVIWQSGRQAAPGLASGAVSGTGILHRGARGWREFDYQRDILPYLDWPSLHLRQAVVCSVRRSMDARKMGNREMASSKGMERTGEVPEAASVLSDTAFDIPSMVQQLLDLVPNPWQCVRVLEEALAMLSEQGLSEAALFRARPMLLQVMRSDLQQQVAERAERLFRRKLAMGEIRQHN